MKRLARIFFEASFEISRFFGFIIDKTVKFQDFHLGIFLYENSLPEYWSTKAKAVPNKDSPINIKKLFFI